MTLFMLISTWHVERWCGHTQNKWTSFIFGHFLIRYQIQQKKNRDSSMHSILILLIALFCLSLGVFVWSSSITRRANWKCLTSHTSIWCNHPTYLIESIAISMQWTHESLNLTVGSWPKNTNSINSICLITLNSDSNSSTRPNILRIQIFQTVVCRIIFSLCVQMLSIRIEIKNFLLHFAIYWDWILCSIE